MKRLLVSVFIALTALWFLPPAEGNQKGRLSQLMIDKLRSTQSLLQGIALSDFDRITKAAEELIKLSRTADWIAHKTPRYEVHSNEFVRAAEALITKAKARNLDGVVLGYMDLTSSCVRCHQYLREIRDAHGPDAPGSPEVLAQSLDKPGGRE